MLVIDRNFKKEALEMVDFLNRKMVTDIEWSVYSTFKNGIEYHDMTFKVYTMHMEFGICDYYFHVDGLNTWNREVLEENISSYFKGIKGLKFHSVKAYA